MISMILFVISLIAIVSIIAVRSVELKTGRQSLLTDVELLVDKVIVQKIIIVRSKFSFALREGLRGLLIFITDVTIDAKQSLGLMARDFSGRLKSFMRERKIENNGATSIFLRDIISHKQTLRQDR